MPELTVGRGEVVGVAGVLGAGQTALLERLAGVQHPAAAEEIRIAGLARLPRSVGEAIDHGILLVSDDRLRKAIFHGLSVGENVLAGSLAQVSRGGFVQSGPATALVRDIVARLRVKCSGPRQDVLQLSGGNQQKVVVAVFSMLVNWTRLGRAVVATGANLQAARLSGINVDRCRMVALTLSALGAAMGASC